MTLDAKIFGSSSAPPHYETIASDEDQSSSSSSPGKPAPPPIALTQPSYRPASNPGTRIYYELFTNRPSGPHPSAHPDEGILHRSHVIWEDLPPPRTWESFCSRVAAQEGIHASRLTAYLKNGRETVHSWSTINDDIGTLEAKTKYVLTAFRAEWAWEWLSQIIREDPVLVKCYLEEGEELEDLSQPRKQGFWGRVVRLCIAPCVDG